MPHTAKVIAFVSTYEAIEESVFANTTSFKDRLDAISVCQVENEAHVQSVKAAMDQLISDMQAFSHSLTEGPRSAIHLSGPVFGTDFPIAESARA